MKLSPNPEPWRPMQTQKSWFFLRIFFVPFNRIIFYDFGDAFQCPIHARIYVFFFGAKKCVQPEVDRDHTHKKMSKEKVNLDKCGKHSCRKCRTYLRVSAIICVFLPHTIRAARKFSPEVWSHAIYSSAVPARVGRIVLTSWEQGANLPRSNILSWNYCRLNTVPVAEGMNEIDFDCHNVKYKFPSLLATRCLPVISSWNNCSCWSSSFLHGKRTAFIRFAFLSVYVYLIAMTSSDKKCTFFRDTFTIYIETTIVLTLSLAKKNIRT